jgi:hypothetical protein
MERTAGADIDCPSLATKVKASLPLNSEVGV